MIHLKSDTIGRRKLQNLVKK